MILKYPYLNDIPVTAYDDLNITFDNNLKFVTTLNVEILLLSQKNSKFKEIIKNSIVTIDGKWIFWALKKKYKNQFKLRKISGSDIIYEIPKIAKKHSKKVLLLGSTPEANKKAVEKLRNLTGYENIFGFSPPFSNYPFSKEFSDSISNLILELRPDIIVTAFGIPKQEFWAWENRELLKKAGVNYVFFLGGALNMVAGIEKKAPKWVSEAGLESVYRLINNPRRFKRFINQLRFIPLLISNKL